MLGEVFKKYLTLRQAQNISPSTLQYERTYHEALWKYLGDSTNNELQIKANQIQDYALHVRSLPLKQNAKIAKVKALRGFYREAVKQGWLIKSPMDEIEIPKREENTPSILSIEQVKTLLETPSLNTIVGLRDRTMMELLYSCGFRIGELLSLTPNSFFENFRLVKVIGKGNKEAVLPVGKMASHFAKFYTKEIYPKFNTKGYSNLFLSTTGRKPMTKANVNLFLIKYTKQASIPLRVSPHTFRYSIATHLAEENVDVRLIQTFLRHEHIDTTSRYIAESIHKLKEVHKRTHPREARNG